MLEEFREEIDAIDEQIMQLLGRRFDICRRVGEVKREHQIPMMQSDRVEQIRQRSCERALRYGLDPEWATALYRHIIDATCQLEDEIIDGEAHS